MMREALVPLDDNTCIPEAPSFSNTRMKDHRPKRSRSKGHEAEDARQDLDYCHQDGNGYAKPRRSKRMQPSTNDDQTQEQIQKHAQSLAIKEAYTLDVAEQLRCIHADLMKVEEVEGQISLDLGWKWKDCSKQDKQRILFITEQNMAGFYGSQWSKIKRGKDKEMRDQAARYLIVRNNQREIVGFCNYRFDMEEDWLVLYVYELQVLEQYRGRRIGKLLLVLSEKLAQTSNMECIMLTVLKRNEFAERFYLKNGYAPSVIDPTYMYPMDEKKYDYRILQKFVKKG